MKNKDIEKYNLTDKEKQELKHLRNLRRRRALDAKGKTRLRELQLNGQKE